MGLAFFEVHKQRDGGLELFVEAQVMRKVARYPQIFFMTTNCGETRLSDEICYALASVLTLIPFVVDLRINGMALSASILLLVTGPYH